MLPNPFGEPDHDQAFAAALGVPDDAAFALSREWLGGSHAEILVVPAKLLHPGVENDKIVDQFQKTCLAAKMHERTVEGIPDVARLFPRQVILFRRQDRAVTQALRVIARHDELRRGKEPFNENLLLIVEILADAFGD